LPAPGVFFYSRRQDIPREEGMLIAVVDDDGDDEAAGYHNLLGGVVDMGQSRFPSRTLDHEALEILRNWRLDEWAPGPGGRRYAMELADPVQRDSYEVEVTILDETRRVVLSNWVTPAWFGLASGPVDYLGRLTDPFSLAPGGYAIAQEADGEIVFLAHLEGAAMPASRFGSRTRWLLERAAGAPKG
jgi:hypothetical protein